MTTIDTGFTTLALAGEPPVHVWRFEIPKDTFMNANDQGYARTWRQQCYVNHKRTEMRKALVAMGMEAAADWPHPPLRRAFVHCLVGNPTKNRFDPPNAEPTEKHILDGLVQSGVLVDDDHEVVAGTLFSYLPEKMQGHYLLELRVYDLTTNAQEA